MKMESCSAIGICQVCKSGGAANGLQKLEKSLCNEMTYVIKG